MRNFEKFFEVFCEAEKRKVLNCLVFKQSKVDFDLKAVFIEYYMNHALMELLSIRSILSRGKSIFQLAF